MRDYALLTILLSFVVLALYRPWLGVLGLAVLGFMHPQGYGEGFMKTFPAYMILFAATSTGYLVELIRKQRWPEIHWDWRPILLVLLFGWFFISTYHALAPFAAREKLMEVLKILPPLVLVWLLIDTREKLFLLLASIAISITLITVKGGYWAVMTGFNDRVYGPPGSQYADNNEFAVATAMSIPLLFLWMRETRDKALHWIIGALLVMSYLAALTSWSRGGLLSLIAMSVFLVWYSRRKLLAIPAALLGVFAVPMIFSEKWLARMQSILAFGDDGSAQSRLGIWEIGWEATLKRPIAGNGFNAWPLLSESDGRFLDWHSAYVEMLAEHGFAGLAIWAVLMVGAVVSLGFLVRLGRRTDQEWVQTHAGMLQASLMAYLAGALTLGIAYWELPFWLVVCTGLMARFAGSSQKHTMAFRASGMSASLTDARKGGR